MVNFLKNKKYLAIAICLISFALVSFFCPEMAFAYSDDEKLKEAGFDITDPGTAIFIVGIGNLILSLAEMPVNLAKEFYGTITGSNLFTNGIDYSGFATVMSTVSNIVESLVPIGIFIVGVFAGIEGLKVAKETKGLSTQWLGLGIMESWFVYVLKYYIMLTLVTNAKAFMLMVYGMVGWIQTKIVEGIGGSSGSGIEQNSFFDLFTELVNNATIGDGVGYCFILFLFGLIILVVVAATAIYIQVLAIMRLFEIFIYIAISPVPLATLTSSITSHIGQGYIKQFCGACLQIGILFLIISLAGPLMGGIANSLNEIFTQNQTGIAKIMGCVTVIATTLALFLMAKQSRQISDRMCGAH